MAADITALKAQLEKLREKRRSGIYRTRIGDREVFHRSDAELTAQIAALESYIASLEGSPSPHTVVVRATKGW
jgi:hypothetical protein